jgi:hypothetical protein
LFIILYSTSCKDILALSTSTSNVLVSLKIVRVTLVHAGHLIKATAQLESRLLSISFPSTLIILSQALSHAFSEGDHEIGEIIVNSQGFCKSTYAPIHSNSQAKESIKSFDSTGGKNVVYLSPVEFASHSIAPYIILSLSIFLLL